MADALPGPEKEYRLFENAFHRWIIIHFHNPHLGWSGSRWVAIDDLGFPAGGVQISNFPSIEAADEAARIYGLLPSAAPLKRERPFLRDRSGYKRIG